MFLKNQEKGLNEERQCTRFAIYFFWTKNQHSTIWTLFSFVFLKKKQFYFVHFYDVCGVHKIIIWFGHSIKHNKEKLFIFSQMWSVGLFFWQPSSIFLNNVHSYTGKHWEGKHCCTLVCYLHFLNWFYPLLPRFEPWTLHSPSLCATMSAGFCREKWVREKE